MPITEDDFRALLAQRSAGVQTAPDQLASVHRRIAVRQRNVRAAMAGGLVVVALGGGFGVPALLAQHKPSDAATQNPTRTPAPTVAPTVAPELAPAAYSDGGKLLAGGVLHSPADGSVTVHFVPTSWPITIRTWCSPGWNDETVSQTLSIDGGLDSSGGCGGAVTFYAPPSGVRTTQGSVTIGKPSSVTVSLSVPRLKGPIATPRPIAEAKRPTGSLSVGIYERVPVGEYPFPTAPATLEELDLTTMEPSDTLLDSRVVGSNLTTTIQVPVRGAQVTVETVAPGMVQLFIAGKLVRTAESWDYHQLLHALTLDNDTLRQAGVSLPTGKTLTVTVVTSRFPTAGWLLRNS